MSTADQRSSGVWRQQDYTQVEIDAGVCHNVRKWLPRCLTIPCCLQGSMPPCRLLSTEQQPAACKPAGCHSGGSRSSSMHISKSSIVCRSKSSGHGYSHEQPMPSTQVTCRSILPDSDDVLKQYPGINSTARIYLIPQTVCFVSKLSTPAGAICQCRLYVASLRPVAVCLQQPVATV